MKMATTGASTLSVCTLLSQKLRNVFFSTPAKSQEFSNRKIVTLLKVAFVKERVCVTESVPTAPQVHRLERKFMLSFRS